MPLTPEQRKKREHKFTASVAPIVMSGDEAALLKLWREMIGETEPEDLSDQWPPMLGAYMENFILDWHERKTGQPIVERQRFVQHPGLPDVGCTLDGYRPHDDCTIDAKVCNSWQSLDYIIGYYAPQCVVQRECRQAARCALLVMHGSAEPRELEVITDAAYEREIWSRIASFLMCVQALMPPVPLPKCTPPEQWRTVNLDDEPKPNWAPDMIQQLHLWSETKAAADSNTQAADVIKRLVPEDVGRLRWTNLQVRRDRRGYLSIKKENA
jgi:YqaJ-like recombinase protein